MVHSVKLRIKDSGKLIAKIIRKQLDHIERPDEQRSAYSDCTPDTYRSRITDLIGIRALHLYKADWPAIHARGRVSALRENWAARKSELQFRWGSRIANARDPN
jgi:ppGpp synthetase/RelA/SpoT-type nucleotidyltranferase